jgi:hypothetical protein
MDPNPIFSSVNEAAGLLVAAGVVYDLAVLSGVTVAETEVPSRFSKLFK